jgi:hypothetical protein
MDWAGIAEKCGTTPGAASKRYSRMKQAFDRGDAAPTTPSKAKNASNATPSSPSGTTPTPKRKRATAASSKKKAAGDNERFKSTDDDDDEDEFVEKKHKRTKSGAGGSTSIPRVTPKLKTKGKQTPTIKEEPDQSAGFLVRNSSGNDHASDYYTGNHLLTPTHSGSINPAEATTLIKTDPDAPHAHPNSMRGPMYGAPADDGEEHFYDANEIFGENEGTFTQESELRDSRCKLCECRGNWVSDVLANQSGDAGVHEWLDEI